MTKNEIREAAFILLYQIDLNGIGYDEALETSEEAFDIITNSAVKKLVTGIVEKKDELDEIISKYSTTRSLQRIPKINLSILRIAIYEMNNPDVPDKVAINEAIELSKKYAEKKDSSFISGLLGSYFKEKNNDK